MTCLTCEIMERSDDDAPAAPSTIQGLASPAEIEIEIEAEIEPAAEAGPDIDAVPAWADGPDATEPVVEAAGSPEPSAGPEGAPSPPVAPPPAPTPRRRRDDVGHREAPTPRRRRTDRLSAESAPAAPEPELAGTPEDQTSAPMHHDGPSLTEDGDTAPVSAVDPRRREAVTSLVGRLRPVHQALDDLAERTDRVFDRVVDVQPGTIEPSSSDPTLSRLHRGDMGEGRVGQTLEGARIQGLEVLHGVEVVPGRAPVDHLVVAVNGVWVVRAVPVLKGRLERRDLGDWFNADPRLFVADEDCSELPAAVRAQVEATTALLAGDSFGDIPVRGVLCFGSIQPGWVREPFVLDGVSITWRSRLVEPMLDPVLVDTRSRAALVRCLATAVSRPGAQSDPDEADASSAATSRQVAG